MRKLDRSKAFGIVSPPYSAPDFDRPAHYEQGGALFDSYDREIIPGQPAPALPAAAAPVEEETPLLSPRELIAQADSMPWSAWQKSAALVLGEQIPAGKSAILQALQTVSAEFDRKRARKTPPAAPKAEASPASDSHAPAPAKPATRSETVSVDLKAWAQGGAEYLFKDVRQAIRTQYNRGVTERRDAVEFLIEQKVLTAAEARRDV
jgi:hypothetical protein